MLLDWECVNFLWMINLLIDLCFMPYRLSISVWINNILPGHSPSWSHHVSSSGQSHGDIIVKLHCPVLFLNSPLHDGEGKGREGSWPCSFTCRKVTQDRVHMKRKWYILLQNSKDYIAITCKIVIKNRVRKRR